MFCDSPLRRAAFGLSLCVLISGAAAAETIRVVCDDNYPPYSFRSADGGIQGIIPDQWKEWSRATGREVDFRAMDWSDCQDAMEAGEADVIDSLFKTPERERVYDFLEPYATLKVPVFFHASISGISEVDDLRGFRIAVKAGDAAAEFLRDRGIVDLVPYPNYEAIVEAAAAEEIRVFCMDEPPARYYLYKLDQEKNFRSALNLNTGEFHRAVRKTRRPLADGSDLLAVLEAGFEAIPEANLKAIDRRWFGTSLARRIDLRAFAWTGAAVAAVLIFLIAFSFALRREVARKTRDLRKKTADLEASERKNRAFIEALPDLFVVIDAAGVYYECKTVNPELLVRPESELIGRNMREFGFSPELQDLLLSSAARALGSPGVVLCEYELDVIAGKRSFEARFLRMEEERVLLIIRDISAKAQAERKVAESLRQKETLLKEVHHRVKNNMQVVSSLIQLQAANLRHAEEREVLQETQQRIRTMAQIHELLYRSDDLESIDAAEYIASIAAELRSAYSESSSDIRLDLRLETIECTMDVAVPLGLIVNELLSNCFKYARGAEVSVSLDSRSDGRRALTVADTGPGLPEGWEERAHSTLGLTLVKLLAGQLRGELSIRGTDGTRVDLLF